MKLTTMPRLELLAALLGVRFMKTITTEHSLIPASCTLWSDSKTVLQWINSKNRRYKPFVAHRINEILASSNSKSWRWIPTRHNVADDATRWNSNIDLSPTARWFTGSAFLKEPEDSWLPIYIPPIAEELHDEEIKTNCFW